MADFNNIKSAQSLRRAALNGRNSSEAINDSFEEILHDLAELYEFVNNTIIPIINGLGAAGTYNDLNVITQGLDGKTLVTDRAFTDVNNIHFYNSSQGRPKSVYETSLKFSQDINALYTRVNTINARLGAIDQDESTNPATLAEIENKLNYFIGITRTIQSNTSEYLTASGIATALNNQAINPASFHIGRDDIELNTGIRPTDISGVDLTVSFDYTTGIPATYDMTDSIQRVKEFVEDISGDAIVTFANSGLSGDSLKTHRDSVGTGTVTANNVHGLDVVDLDDSTEVQSRITEIAHFDVKISGLIDSNHDPIIYGGGYHQIPASYEVTKIMASIAKGGTTGIRFGVFKRSAGGSEVHITSGLLAPASTPGFVTETTFTHPANANVVEGDKILVSDFSGDGYNMRVFVFGKPV